MNKRLLRHDAAVLPTPLLERIKQRRVHARTVRPDGVRVTTRSGTQYLLPLQPGMDPVGDNLSVYVWWTAEGLVCATVNDVDAAEARLSDVGDQVKRAREELARARAARSHGAPRSSCELVTAPGELALTGTMPLMAA